MKRFLCVLLVLGLMLSLAGCGGSKGTAEIAPSEAAQSAPLTAIFREAVDAGIAWEDLQEKINAPIAGADLVRLITNAMNLLGKGDSLAEFAKFADMYRELESVERYRLAQLLYAASQDVQAGHDFILNATAISYEVGGAYAPLNIGNCPDVAKIDEVCPDSACCDYAICAFDRVTGDKLMDLYEDFSFRPTELVTVEEAVESVFHFARSFEKNPVYVDVTDAQASVCTIDPALYTGETTLPDATNQDLPNWRGCNISYNSMFAGGLCWNPDDVFVQANLDYLKDLGVNYVHIYLSWSYFQGPDHTFDNKVNLSRLEQLDEIISWCMDRDIHIQLVFNDVPNLDWNNLSQDPAWGDAWNSCFWDEAVRDNVTAFWRMLSRRYADIPNNYLSFNLMNECDPADDDNYLWALGDAVAAIWEESPGRVVVADVHTTSLDVTGESMAALGCALSYHFYNLRDISVVNSEKEEAVPGFYAGITGTPALVNAHLYGPDYWDTGLPEAARGGLRFTGAVGGATLSVKIGDISWFDTVMEISADGQTLYKDMVPHNYIKEYDYFEIPGDGTVTVTIPENAAGFEISCPAGSCFTMSDISLTLKDGSECPLMLLNDSWSGTPLTEITIQADGSTAGTIGLEYIKQGASTLMDLLAVGEKYGVDVMVGEFGLFEGSEPMAAGISQEATEKLLLDQINTFEKYNLAWCCEYIGRYTLVTPAPYLAGIEYRDLENSPYYVNMEMDAFFREILAE